MLRSLHHRQLDLLQGRGRNTSYGPPSTKASQDPYQVLWNQLLCPLRIGIEVFVYTNLQTRCGLSMAEDATYTLHSVSAPQSEVKRCQKMFDGGCQTLVRSYHLFVLCSMLICLANVTNTTTRTNRRSCSAPGRTHQQDTLSEHEEVGMEYYETTSPSRQDLKEEALTNGERTKSLKRASSVLLPAELNDFVFSRLQREAFDADCRKVEASCGQSHPNVSKEESGNEVPPAVPPKTLPGDQAPNLHVSPLKLHPTNGPACDKALPQIGPVKTTPPPTSDFPKGQGLSNHVRKGSVDSVMDRGRPPTRTRSPTKKGIMGSGNPSSDDLTCDTLPKGLPANTASTSLSREELRRLGHQARSQAARFEVLQVKDVKALSQVCTCLVGDKNKQLLTR